MYSYKKTQYEAQMKWNGETQKQLVTSKFQAKSLKNRIEYSRYWQN